jgi:hypothetical protein
MKEIDSAVNIFLFYLLKIIKSDSYAYIISDPNSGKHLYSNRNIKIYGHTINITTYNVVELLRFVNLNCLRYDREE